MHVGRPGNGSVWNETIHSALLFVCSLSVTYFKIIYGCWRLMAYLAHGLA